MAEHAVLLELADDFVAHLAAQFVEEQNGKNRRTRRHDPELVGVQKFGIRGGGLGFGN